MSDVKHGGNLLEAVAEYGDKPEDWLDLSTGISPFMIDLPTMPDDVWRRLPDPTHLRTLEGKARDFFGTELDCLVTAGSQFTIQKLPDILKGDVGIFEPTYGEYANAFKQSTRAYKSLKSIEDINHVQHVILANPNNPDGRTFDHETLVRLAEELSRNDGFLVVDEAFASFGNKEVSLLANASNSDNIIILKSIGKFFGLAGVRLGLVFGPSQICNMLDRYRGPWSVSGPALYILGHILSEPVLVEGQHRRIQQRHKEMLASISKSKFELVGKNDLFFLLSCDNAKALGCHLKENQILTRVFDYHPNWMRIGLALNAAEDARLLSALEGFS